MAKRPEQSLDVLGQSLLSQQSATRKKADKRRRRDERGLKVLGALVAGQSLVNNALTSSNIAPSWKYRSFTYFIKFFRCSVGKIY